MVSVLCRMTGRDSAVALSRSATNTLTTRIMMISFRVDRRSGFEHLEVVEPRRSLVSDHAEAAVGDLLGIGGLDGQLAIGIRAQLVTDDLQAQAVAGRCSGRPEWHGA